MIFDPKSIEGRWPVMKGESFDLWANDKGPDSSFARADPKTVTARLQAERRRRAPKS